MTGFPWQCPVLFPAAARAALAERLLSPSVQLSLLALLSPHSSQSAAPALPRVLF